MSWSREQAGESVANLQLIPKDVLYYFDGPQLFCAQFGFLEAIFVKIEDGDESYLFLSNVTTEETVKYLQADKLSVRGAFLQPYSWIIETDFNYNVRKYWSLAKQDVPEAFLPKPGVGLHLGRPRVPDSMEQAKAYFSIAFRGESMRAGRMPFSALKGVVDTAYNFSRRVLMPPPLRGSKAATFDMEVEPTIGSLIISVERPTVNLANVSKRLNQDVTFESIEVQIEEQREQFFDAFSVIVASPSSKTSGAHSARELIMQFLDVLPDEDTDYGSVEFSANIDDAVRTVFIDTSTAEQINRYFSVNELERVTRSGKIVEINSQSSTFLLAGKSGRLVTCIVPKEIFKESRLKIGNHGEVSGPFIRRARRDKLYVSTYSFSDLR